MFKTRETIDFAWVFNKNQCSKLVQNYVQNFNYIN